MSNLPEVWVYSNHITCLMVALFRRRGAERLHTPLLQVFYAVLRCTVSG